jgi:hypothetical protein
MPVNNFELSKGVTKILRWETGGAKEDSLQNLFEALRPKLDGNTKEWFLGWLMLQRATWHVSSEYRFGIERRTGSDVRVSLSDEAEARHDGRALKRARH